MKTAGVIGGHDFLGCDITLKLLSENYRVKILIPEPVRDQKPLINTGLKASDKLVFCYVNMQNQLQLKLFLEDCDCLIHCGMPYRLNLNQGEGSIYIPLISDTVNLLKSIKNVQPMGKIIFFTSGSVFNHFNSNAVSGIIQKEKAGTGAPKKIPGKAFYHSGKLLDKIINDFSENQIEIIVVSPVVVLNNSLINNSEATLAGLRYMFRHNIEHDKTFQRLIRRKLMKTMVNVTDLPDRVFDSVESYRENKKNQKLPESIQF